MLRAVAAQALDEPAKHEVTVALEHHVDEVDDDDAADIAEAQLPDDLLGRLEVVPGDSLLEIAALAGELAGVHVDHGHRLGAIDDERAARRQVDLAIERLRELLVDAMLGEDITGSDVTMKPGGQIRCHRGDVVAHGLPRGVAGDHKGCDVLIEDVAHDLRREVGLAVEEGGRRGGFHLAADVVPLRLQPGDVLLECILGCALGSGAHNDAGVLGHDSLEDPLEARALGIGQLAANTGHRAVGHVDKEAPGQRHLACQASALLTDRVLRHLDEDRIARLQRELDALGLAFHARDVPVDLAGVEHGVAAPADVDERGLHARQHVLHATKVDIADEGPGGPSRDVVLDEDAVLEHGDLGAIP
ncbi:unannotated protein [freshwater metagenome]|uniref:Unannotated protein n=1 Tax=freshwater metagenome TaxID=449393 RepID=A0A6J7R7T6_9ZZZZ